MRIRCFLATMIQGGSLALAGLLVACGSHGGSGKSGGVGGGVENRSTASSTLGSTGGSSIGSIGGSSIGSTQPALSLVTGVLTSDGGTSTASGFTLGPATVPPVTVTLGKTPPTVHLTATSSGSPVNAAWGVDQGDIGVVTPSTGGSVTFVPSGTTGGTVKVTANYNGVTVTRSIVVKLVGTQNGANATDLKEAQQIPGSVAALSAGGGVGGVGGEGLGPAVTDQTILAALASPTGSGSALSLSLLYPYDKTVWPRGMLAPLLMWSLAAGDAGVGSDGGVVSADAIQIQLSTASGSFSWMGTFGPPAILAQTSGSFIRHPIPQDIWDMATNTASGPSDPLTVSLTVAAGGAAYGPVSETWIVAPALLTGTVYYNSYATQLVKNWTTTDAAGNRVGAAILGITSGATAPALIVGENSTNDSGCRVCHTVASRGRWLLTQSEQGNPHDGESYLYDLQAANVPTSGVALAQQGVFAWAALDGNATYALTNTVNPSSSNQAITNSSNADAISSFWQFGAQPVQGALVGLGDAGLAAGYPSYSPDDTRVAYIDVTGSTNSVHGPLMVASYDATTQTFSGVTQVLPPPAAGQKIGYPVFLPDNSGVLFETQVRSADGTSGVDNVVVTRDGARSELWWVNLNGPPQPVALAALNGKSGGTPYIPVGGNNHGTGPNVSDPETAGSGYSEVGYDDTTLNYEPTVLPVVAGGYAWVVFTSRRLYGNQLTSLPWLSWPPDYNTTDLAEATVKKIWVAAIDLNAAPGSDPSHPPFYLPAQEILAGNSRGFWVLSPCRQDGAACQSGDQCCNGFCEPGGDAGGLVCSNAPPDGGACSQLQEKCTTASDCCDTAARCIAGFCALSGPT
jgi:hypothetical protein